MKIRNGAMTRCRRTRHHRVQTIFTVNAKGMGEFTKMGNDDAKEGEDDLDEKLHNATQECQVCPILINTKQSCK